MNGSGERGERLSPVKRAILELREMREELDDVRRRRREPVAIVGVGLRFPGGAHDADSFWRMLIDGVDAIGEIPPGRWDVEGYFDADPDVPGKMYTRHGGFLGDVAGFDAHAFGISPREAVSMDPQQRLLLEVGWEALEDAGQAPDRLEGSATAVYVGINNSDYFRRLLADRRGIDAYVTTGNAFSVSASRLSYLLGLRGPSVAVDTACSSSLVALHLAMRGLRAGECDMALAGGVNLILSPEISINFCKARMLSIDGRCKAFDAGADGYGRGEGCGVVVLKRISDALAARDRILAVVRGTSINQDGRSGGIAAPNGPAQRDVIRAALGEAGVEPREVGFVETHGTGTTLGDPIEARALGEALGGDRPSGSELLIGSVKTNFGHLEAAAGVAGLIKAALAVRHGTIPPHLHLKKINPHISPAELGLAVATAPTPWPAAGDRRIAGVSSFGISGTNAHVVLEEPPPPVAPAEDPRRTQLLVLSARSASSLEALGAKHAEMLCRADAPAFPDVCFTSAAGRASFPHRLAVVASDAEEARERLLAHGEGQEREGLFAWRTDEGPPPEIVFLFAGQGDQFPGMGRRLYETQPVFREALDQCDELLRSELDRPLLSVMYPDSGDETILNRIAYAQPALFALEYALARLWRSWGVEPSVVLGHSAGEYAAACVAGVFGLEDGLKLIAARGRLIQELPEDGAMVVLRADEDRARRAVAPHADRVSVAAINGPENTVISGDASAVGAIVRELSSEGVETTPLEISHASHSPSMEPALDAFERIAAGVRCSPPRVRLISNVTGEPVGAGDLLDASYWRRHLRQPVRFADSMALLEKQGYALFLELGPHTTLVGMGRSCRSGDDALWLPSLRRGQDDETRILDSLSELYVRGARVDWEGFHRPFGRNHVSLPTYCWQRKRYWAFDTPIAATAPEDAPAARWERLREAGRRQASQAPLDLPLHTYEEKWNRLDRLASAYIVEALRGWGVFVSAGEERSIDDLIGRLGIRESYRNLLRRWIERLCEEGLLVSLGDQRYAARAELPGPRTGSLLREAELAFEDAPFFVEYVAACGRHLRGVLEGRISALDTLFPGGSTELAESLYRDWAGARYFNGIVRQIAAAAASSGRPLRVIEVGAGTGGTTSAVLPALPPERTEYWFTDLSEFFFQRARGQFRRFPFVRYGLLDVERDPGEQGYAPGGFDLVLAANVLHATRDLGRALDHARSLLVPGGSLVLYETTDHLHWFHVTVGLVEGWQRFDDGLRGDQPLLSAEQWTETLLARGFDAVESYPEDDSPAAILSSRVLLARAPEGAAPGARTEWRPPSEEDHPGAEPSPADGAPAGARAARDRSREFVEQLRLTSPSERGEMLVSFVARHVGRVLRLDPTDPVDSRQRLMDMGIDSLMAVELRDRLRAGLFMDAPLPATLVFDHPTVEAIADYLDRRLVRRGEETEGDRRASAGRPAEGTARAAEIESLSDDEVEAILLKKLEEREREGR